MVAMLSNGTTVVARSVGPQHGPAVPKIALRAFLPARWRDRFGQIPCAGLPLRAAVARVLLWGALSVCVRTEHAAIAGFRAERDAAGGASIEELAGVRRHRFI